LEIKSEQSQLWDFSLRHHIQTGSGAHPASYPMGITGALTPGVKRPECEANHSSPSSAEVKNTWSSTATLPIRLHCVVLGEAQG
jgi:hypothetical protein